MICHAPKAKMVSSIDYKTFPLHETKKATDEVDKCSKKK